MHLLCPRRSWPRCSRGWTGGWQDTTGCGALWSQGKCGRCTKSPVFSGRNGISVSHFGHECRHSQPRERSAVKLRRMGPRRRAYERTTGRVCGLSAKGRARSCGPCRVVEVERSGYIMPPMPPIPPMSPMPPPAPSFDGLSAIMASVVISRPATEAAS